MILAGHRQRADEPAGLHLDMLISDFGPIKKAAISLRPLTIFIGPNNTGKSYAAMLAHSAMSAARGIGPSLYSLTRSARRQKALESTLSEMEKALAALRSTGEVKCPPKLANSLTRSCTEWYNTSLQNEIVRNFGSGLRELVRSGTSHFSLSLKNKSGRTVSYKKGRLALTPMPKFDMRFRLSPDVDGVQITHAEHDGNMLYCDIASDVARMRTPRSSVMWLYSELQSSLLRHILAGIPGRSDYFPAARSGILQAHRMITSNIVRNAPYAGIEDIHVPRLSGVVSDFVSAIIDMHPYRGIHHDAGSRIESDIFAGHVHLKYRDPDSVPEIVYERSKVTVPIHRASSTISELAPLTLYLKHATARGVIVIEEPEAHLHPHNQAVLAGHIVRLVRGGANIIITTHSAPLFEAISQYLQAGPLPPRDRKNALGHEDLYLGEHEVAPHLFKQGAGGSVVEPVDMSAKEGIEQEEFIREDRLLSENNMRLVERMY